MALRQLLACLVFIIFYDVVQLEDPCTKAKTLGQLSQRQIGYALGTGETSISDFRLQPGWYKLPEHITLATNATQCGAYFTWWLQDPLPKTGTSDLQMCQNNGKSDCAEHKTIQVQKCPDGYVYHLNPTDSDLEAYCIELTGSGGTKPDDAPDISRLGAKVSAGVHQEGIENFLEFYCNLNLPDPSYQKLLYNIEWSLHSGVSKLSSVHFVESIPYETHQKFRDKTKLSERHLTNNLVTKPGFTIVCAVTARKSILGRLSSTKDSPPKFCGVKVLTPSRIRIEKDSTFDVKLQLTIPFGCIRSPCTLDFDMLVPEKDKKTCLLSDLVHQPSPEGRHCGVKFEHEDDIATFKVSAAFGTNIGQATSKVYELMFQSHKHIPNHAFFQGYKLPPTRVELLVDQASLQNKECHGVSDPHMQTFNGNRYENQHAGTFIMYRHKLLHAEVQTKTTLCYEKFGYHNVYCHCGVAVRAGKDIFLVDNCEKGQTQPPRTVFCNDRVLYRQIKRKDASYEIMLPHGAKVVLTYKQTFWDVYIYPSLVDMGKTEGLCGLFGGPGDDKVSRTPGAWRVPQKEDLFQKTNYHVLHGWSEELAFCDCLHKDDTSGLSFDNTKCSSQRKCTVQGSSVNLRQDMCDIHTRRKKRDASGIQFDTYTDHTTAFYHVTPTGKIHIGHNVRSKRRTPYTNVTARADCLQMMNTSIFQKCDKIPNFDTDGMINNCVLDAVVTNTMDWTMAHLESIKQTCIEHVEVMQPLPPAVRAELVVLPDDNITDLNNETYEYPTLPPPTLPPLGADPITADLLEDIKTHSCPNECEGHGKCENGTCKCEEPYTSFDCSIDRTKPPIMLGIPDKGECDLQQRLCAETAVFGRNFAETPSLSCRLDHFVVDQNYTMQSGQSVDVEGSYESMFEVYCRFPESRRKRSVPDWDSDGEIAYGYHTSVSNDGKSFSEGDTIIIYDSQCVNCTKVKGDIICIKESGYCLKHGRCYTPGETLDCFVCADEGGDDVQWSPAPDCNVAPKPEAMKTWMIGLIAASSAVAFVALVSVMCYIGKRKSVSRRKVNGSMNSIQ